MISIIVPVYNRPQEIQELLESLSHQSDGEFEIVIVEDGSKDDCAAVVHDFATQLNITYVVQPNAGPAAARNRGASEAKGEVFVFMDSDCIVPADYVATLNRHLKEEHVEFFGGPDSAAADFTPLQKAVSYSMTSFFTTGGIRGGGRKLEKFCPRSFNLGIARDLFFRVDGFTDMRIGEDIDFSKKVFATGAVAHFFPDAVVCHKRRTSMRLFFKQVFIFGTARVNLNIRHPQTRRVVYLLPMLFTLGSFALLVCAAAVSPWFLAPLAVLMLLWAVDSGARNRSVRIGWLSIWTSFIQLYGYGIGYLYGLWNRYVRGWSEEQTWVVTRYFSKKTR